MKNISIHPFLWWGLPLALLLANLVAEVTVPQAYKPHFYSEGGPIEKIQEIFLFISIILAAILCVKVKGLWLKLWFAVAVLCSIYVLGEEISWGQHYFNWTTPDYWLHINDQQETNLHNTSAWLDQKPRIMLQLGVLVGGLVIPVLQYWKPQALPEKFSAIYPTWHLAFTAFLAVLVKIEDWMNVPILHRSSEIMEMYLYYFVFLYLLLMKKRFSAS